MVVLPKNLNATKINLNGLDLKEIPQEVFKYKNLRKLFLQNNKIKRIPQEINQLKLLSILDISNNQINSLHAKICDLKKLEVLILNNNNIKTIPIQIKNLQRLRILGIANNKLTELITSIEFLKELKELNLSGNNFSKFPIQIIQLNKLERLWIKQVGTILLSSDTFEFLNNSSIKIYHYNANEVVEKSIVEEQTKIKEEVPMKPDKKKIFISYSHNDLDWLEKVEKHLKVLSIYSGLDFEVWSDKRIASGQKWKKEIENALKESTAAILLVSTDFLISDFIHNEELQPLLKKAEHEGTKILQLIINPCGYKRIKSLNVFQTVNDPKNEILTQLTAHQQDEIFERLVDDVARHIEGK